jgi:Zn-dependent protease with chaperone function
VEPAVRKLGFCCEFVLCCVFCVPPALSQQIPDAPQVPRNFALDFETAARLRPQLVSQSVAATGEYSVGRVVLDRLIEQVPKPGKFRWELRIVPDGQLNAYSSPDGTIYVETGLARLAGRIPGLWAAMLSHEMAHVLRRDWARRYLYQRSLETSAGTIMLGEPGLASASDAHWSDGQSASQQFARFCRQLEIEADREGLRLMALAGYHPDFVPALHHLLHAQASVPSSTSPSVFAMHPCWEERDRELSRAYVEAGIEFERRWLDWYASPGGNPPTLVFAEPPTIKKTGQDKITGAKEWELLVPMRCENLVGVVEVVLGFGPLRGATSSAASPRGTRFADQYSSAVEHRQLTGCTSPRTAITFTLADSNARWTDVYILDASGAILARADVPKLPR